MEITADDSISGIKEIKYLISEVPYENIEDILNQEWSSYETTIVRQPSQNEKFSIYAKLIDNAGNISIINTDEIVVYKDSLQDTKSIWFTKTNTNDVSANITLNGNTVSKITNGENTLILNTDYKIEDSLITFKSTYLDSLSVGNYNLIIYYNPAGENYISGTSIGDVPSTTSIELTVSKAVQNSLSFDNIHDNYTYGDNEITLETIGGSGTGNVNYYLTTNDGSVSLLGNVITIIQPGTFTVKAIKNGDNNYKEITAEKTIIINQKSVTIIGVSANNKIYDGTTSATFYDIGTILGIVGSDVLSIDLSKISASFDNKNTGQNKVVTFSGFSIEGIDSFKYNLFEQPKNSTATISPLETTISGVISENKVYYGTTNAEISGAHVVDQKINSDDVNILKGKANFSDKKVSANKIVTFSDFKLIGNDATNYTLVSQPQSVYADITPKNLTINVTISDKKYDGINTASFSEAPTINGVVQNDNVILINGKPIFSSISIGTNIEIIFETDFSIEGNDSYNYTLIQPTGITGNILSGFTPIKDIHYIISQPDGLILTDNSSNGWYQSDDFKIIAKDGYKVSTSNTDTSNWTNELIYSDETPDNSSIDIKFYVRNIDQNEISSSKIESYKKMKLHLQEKLLLVKTLLIAF